MPTLLPGGGGWIEAGPRRQVKPAVEGLCLLGPRTAGTPPMAPLPLSSSEISARTGSPPALTPPRPIFGA